METATRASRAFFASLVRRSSILSAGVPLAFLLLLAFASTATATAGRVIPSPHPAAPNHTTGCLICPDGTPLAGCTVTLEYWDSNGIVVVGTTTTNAAGCFDTTILCSSSNNQNEHWVVTSTCCPSTTWTITTTSCFGDLGTLLCQDCTGCTPPPSNMTGWWPLDELVPSTTADMSGGNTCAWIGGPTPLAGQYVNNSTTLPLATTYHSCPTPNGFVNFGTGNFSIDAWVRSSDQNTKVRTIVDHRQIIPGTQLLRGYALYVSFGHIGLQMADGVGTGYTNFGSITPNLWNGVWHHVAATVVRGSATGGLLYVDGVVALTFDPTVRPGTLDNSGSFRIGQAYDNSSQAINGNIDEVEIFKKALSAAEVQALFTTGTHGKCKEACYLPWDVSVCNAVTTVTTNLTICNYSTATATYTWSMAGLPVGTGCSVPGPTGFAPAAGTVTVTAGSCLNVPITITSPGIPGTNVACYQATVTNTSSGHVMHCGGSLQGNPSILCVGTAVLADYVTLLGIKTVTFDLSNQGDVSVTQTVEAVAMPADMSPVERVISLWGLPPGIPWLADVTIAPHSTQHVTVDCTWTDHDPFVPHDIILSADVDGDGDFEPLATCQLSETSQTPVAIGDGPGRTSLPGLAVSPAPFRDQMNVRFTLESPSDVRVEVWDVSGRLVRTLHTGAMTRGTQSVAWDGTLANGRAATSGLYLVRVQAGSRVLTAKVLRIP